LPLLRTGWHYSKKVSTTGILRGGNLSEQKRVNLSERYRGKGVTKRNSEIGGRRPYTVTVKLRCFDLVGVRRRALAII
jgi:hypothetical protein